MSFFWLSWFKYGALEALGAGIFLLEQAESIVDALPVKVPLRERGLR